MYPGYLFQVADMIRHVLDSYTQAIPAVLEIPSKEHPYDASKDSILRRAKVSVHLSAFCMYLSEISYWCQSVPDLFWLLLCYWMTGVYPDWEIVRFGFFDLQTYIQHFISIFKLKMQVALQSIKIFYQIYIAGLVLFYLLCIWYLLQGMFSAEDLR